MLRSLLLTAALGLALAAPAAAQRVHTDHDSVARIVSRRERTEARYSILSRDRNTTLLLTDTTMILQLTDKGLDEVGQLDDDEDEAEDHNLAIRILASMLQSGMRALLNHGIEYPLSHINDARVEDGVLVIENDEGELLFDEMELNDQEVMRSFSERDARAFAQKLAELKARLR